MSDETMIQLRLMASIDTLILPAEILWPELNAAIEISGFDAGLLSAGPWERIRKFITEKVWPVVNNRATEFRNAFEASYRSLKEVTEDLGSTLNQWTDEVDAGVRSYVDEMLREGLAGPKTATLVITMATADALQKVLLSTPSLNLGMLSGTDWLMLALFWLRFRDQGTPPDIQLPE